MKFAFCLFKYFPFGGLQRDFVRIARVCLARGHQVDVYTMEWQGETIDGLNIIIVPAHGLQNHRRIHSFVQTMQSHLQAGHYDRIVGFNKMPGLDIYYAADICYQSKVAAKPTSTFLYRLTGRYRQLVAYEKAVFGAQVKTKILLIAKRQQAEFERCYQTAAERFFLLPPGIAKDRIAPDNAAEIRAALRKEYGLKDAENLILLVGSGFKAKGLDRALLALHALPKTLREQSRLFVIGQDNAKPFIKQALHLQVKDKVLFLEGRNDVPRFLVGADVLIHPAYNENTGTVLLEALASGLPVLTTDICGYAEYITQADAGIIIDSPFSQEKLNAALVEMLISPQRQHWRKNALAFTKQADIYSLPEHAADLIETLG